jgi:hypothetical protein
MIVYGLDLPIKLFQVIPDNYQHQSKIEHKGEILRNPRKNGIKIFQIRYKQHDQTYYKRSYAELGFCGLIHTWTPLKIYKHPKGKNVG